MTLPETSRSRGRELLRITLLCDGCGHRARLNPSLSITKMGVLRLEGYGQGFYVDGGSVLCRECAGDRLNNRAQRESWGEYDRRAVEADKEDEELLDDLVARHPGLERRR